MARVELARRVLLLGCVEVQASEAAISGSPLEFLKDERAQALPLVARCYAHSLDFCGASGCGSESSHRDELSPEETYQELASRA